MNARRAAPKKMRRRTPTSITRDGPSNTTPSTQPSSSQGTTLPGLTTAPPASSQMRPAKVSYPTNTGQAAGEGLAPLERRWPLPQSRSTSAGELVEIDPEPGQHLKAETLTFSN